MDSNKLIVESQGFIVRLVRNKEELLAIQKLRYDIFFGAHNNHLPEDSTQVLADRYDEVADNMIVIDTNSSGGIYIEGIGRVVGTYRFIEHKVAKANFGFVLDNEFNVTDMIARNPDVNFTELSRAAVLSEYRSRNVVMLMWRFIVLLSRTRSYDVLFGAASFDTTDVSKIAKPLAYLAQNHIAPPKWIASAIPERYIELNPDPNLECSELSVLRTMPPLLRAYLGIGAMIGDGAIIDYDFKTTDVLIVVELDKIPEAMMKTITKSG